MNRTTGSRHVHQSSQSSATIVRLSDIAEKSVLAGRRFALQDATLDHDEAALSGTFRMIRLRQGLLVHTSDTTELRDMTTQIEQQPGLTIHLYIKGGADASLGGKPLNLGRAPGQPPQAVITARAEPDLFERHAHRGECVRKVNITVSRDWLAESAFASTEEFRRVNNFAATHHARFAWVPGPSLTSIAEQILKPPIAPGMMQNLYLESRALDLLSEGFAALAQQSAVTGITILKPIDRRRLRHIEDFLAEHLHEIRSLDELACVGGISVSTLRRLFQAAYGTTVFQRLRQLGLERARHALERQGVSIAQAAFLAGYSSPANFSTAFKRQFGLTPSDIRCH